MPIKKRSRTRPARTICDDTSIIPEAVAEGVVEEAVLLLNLDIAPDAQSELRHYLTGYAEAIYGHNPKFRSKVRSEANNGNAGRDYLYAYMRHWLTSKLLEFIPANDRSRIRQTLDRTGFSMGREIR